MAKVSKRGGFSDRNSIKPESTEIQLKEFDQRTRIQLQNMISKLYIDVYDNRIYYGNDHIQNFLKFIYSTVYAIPVDMRKTYDDDSFFKLINSTIQKDDYDDVLTLIEAIIQYWDKYLKEHKGYSYYNGYSRTYVERSVFDIANDYLEQEYIGYRFVDGIIVPISDVYEVEAIEETLVNNYQPVREHISKANKLLGDRDMPDYENSIKESISAVEAICEIITGMKGGKATLGAMLKKVEECNIAVHPAMKQAFNILYGYTSDANGIRHAGDIGGPSSTFEEAKFMLVSCCAFINYLIALHAD